MPLIRCNHTTETGKKETYIKRTDTSTIDSKNKNYEEKVKQFESKDKKK